MALGWRGDADLKLNCHRPRGDPARRGFLVKRHRFWNTGSPGQAGDDVVSGHEVRHCEERSTEAIQNLCVDPWIASLRSQ